MARNKKPPFQALATDRQTVAAATGVPEAFITEEMLDGLVAGLRHTSSPLKDAAENMLLQKRGHYRLMEIEQTLRRNLIDQMEILNTTSAFVELPKRFRDLEEESQEIVAEAIELHFQLFALD